MGNPLGGPKASRVLVLASGGIDSAVLMWELSHRYQQVVPLYLKSGLVWEAAELYWLRLFLKALSSKSIAPLKIARFPVSDVYRRHWSLTGMGVPGAGTDDASVYLPGRNILFFAKAAIFAALNGIETIFSGVLRGNPFLDSTSSFVQKMGATLSEGLGVSLTIITPYAKHTKEQVLLRGQHLPLNLTFSCIAPRGLRHCGRCNKCAERRRVFRSIRAKSPAK